MKINKYPDGSSYVNSIGIELHNNVFKINSYEDLWHLHQAVDAYYNYFKTKPTIIIPNLIDAQADRRFKDDESSGLKLVCQFLNGMKANFKIFHPHNSEVVEALFDSCEIVSNNEFIERVLIRLDASPSTPNHSENMSDTLLMSADAGGFKPLMKLCKEIGWKGETYSAAKNRHPVTHALTQLIDRQDFGGKDILIIDDISIFGGTFKGLSKLLRERNCGKLYLAVSHMTVQDLGEDPVTNYFDKVFTTNSKFDNYIGGYREVGRIKPMQPENLEIIKLF